MASLLDRLVQLKKLTRAQATELEKIIKTTHKREEEVILEKKIVSEDFLLDLKSKELKIPSRVVYPEDVSLLVLELIPEDSARYYQMIPLEKKANILEVGMVYPEDLKTKEALKFLARQAKFSYKIYLISLSNFEKLLRKYRGLKEEVVEALGELEVEKPKKAIGGEEVKRMAERAPISKIVAVMLRHAVDGGASDIHIEPTKTKLRVRYRTLGRLYSSLFLPITVHPSVVARVKILSELKIDETRIPQDGRFSAKMAGRRIDFRVSTFPTSAGEKVAIRILDPEKGFRPFERLGLEGRNFEAIKDSIQKPFGMILATGPTGSGKTTTLYAILRILNKEEVNV
ncbi:MAG: hypothetical protein COY73_00735, partial [Candidatus Nealsonbacteria bacterium CG_4_10_14_0_8_um_filter_37_14]